MKKLIASALAGVGAVVLAASVAQAEWQPSGPIQVMIGFRAGGGTDTQGRLIFEEVGKRKGWKFIITNIAGKGAANMLAKLKDEPNDGLTIGMAVDAAVTYLPLTSKKVTYSIDDYDYLLTTAPSQMGIVARKDKGWNTLQDLVDYAKAGNKVSIASMSARLDDALYVINQKYGVRMNKVSVKGGRGSMNAIIAGDVDAGFGAGIQGKMVKAGTVVNLVSAEADRLELSPDIQTMKELGMPYSFGVQFLTMAPKGIPEEAKKAIADAMYEVVSDKSTKAYEFIRNGFGKPPLLRGAELDAHMKASYDESVALLEAVSAQ